MQNLWQIYAEFQNSKYEILIALSLDTVWHVVSKMQQLAMAMAEPNFLRN